MEGAIILQETLHELHRKNKMGLFLRLILKKAYDKVKWDFLQQTLKMKGFSDVWCKWIEAFTK